MKNRSYLFSRGWEWYKCNKKRSPSGLGVLSQTEQEHMREFVQKKKQAQGQSCQWTPGVNVTLYRSWRRPLSIGNCLRTAATRSGSRSANTMVSSSPACAEIFLENPERSGAGTDQPTTHPRGRGGGGTLGTISGFQFLGFRPQKKRPLSGGGGCSPMLLNKYPWPVDEHPKQSCCFVFSQ